MTKATIDNAGPMPATAVLLGARGSYANDFRRRVQRIKGLLRSLGMPISDGSARVLLVLAQGITIVIIMFGLLWTPSRDGLRSMGVPLETPDLATVAGALTAVGLLVSRRRQTREVVSWAPVSAATDAGYRLGTVVLDLGFALMLIVQNLRWFETQNHLAALALLVAATVTVLPIKRRTTLTLTAFTFLLSSAGLLALVRGTVPPHALSGLMVGQGQMVGVWAGAVVTAAVVGFVTVLLYTLLAPTHAMRSRGLYLDLLLKTAGLLLISLIGIGITELTPWAPVAPYIGMAAFFLTLIFLRSSLVRITSPESLGYALFLARLAPHRNRSMVRRAALLALCIGGPAAAALAMWLVFRGDESVAALLITLLLLETAAEALIIQRSTAVLPASSLVKLPQKSKTGLAAALCGGVAVTFTGVLTATGVDEVGAGTALSAAGGLIVVAVLLIALAVMDADGWIKDLTATEMEES